MRDLQKQRAFLKQVVIILTPITTQWKNKIKKLYLQMMLPLSSMEKKFKDPKIHIAEILFLEVLKKIPLAYQTIQ